MELIDLFNCPPSNSFLKKEELNLPETYYPLKVYVCEHCFLVQIDEYKKSSTIFNNEYVYFSSYSSSWLEHSRKYCEQTINKFEFNTTDLILEIASNDGYLLQYFKEKGFDVLGIEPTENTASVAITKGIKTITKFFGTELANELKNKNCKPKLIIGNNVLAHVPDINDFVNGLRILLCSEGIITMEFPHLVKLIELNQFDTIYHEHFSYLSFTVVKRIFEKHELTIFDVEEISTHGGSLRIYAKHNENKLLSIKNSVNNLIEQENKRGIATINYYLAFNKKVLQTKIAFLSFVCEQNKLNKKVAAYGAAAKGNTLINYCGIKKDLIEFVVDKNPNKQGKYLPASHIPVVDEIYLKKEKPDYIIIFPWNIKGEITQQLSYIREWNGKFVTAIPELKIF